MARERMSADDKKPEWRTTLKGLTRTYEELKEDMVREIDKHDLDGELVRQPSLYHQAGVAYSECAALRDQLKEYKSRKLVTITEKMRADPNEKFSEARLKSLSESEPEIVKLEDEIAEVGFLASLLASLREDFRSRGYTLQNLGELWIAGYYQSNSVVAREATDRQYERSKSARREAAGRGNESLGRDRFRHRGDD